MGEFDEVEVRNRFTGDWGGGFELQDTESAGAETRFRVRRRSDGALLPGWFSGMEIRPPQSPRDALEPVAPDVADDRVLDLRSSGSSFAAIARSLGLPGAGEASVAFHRALSRRPHQERRAICDAEFARLELLEQRVRSDTRIAAGVRDRRLGTIDRLRDRLLAT